MTPKYLALANPGSELLIYGLTDVFRDDKDPPLGGSNRKRRLEN